MIKIFLFDNFSSASFDAEEFFFLLAFFSSLCYTILICYVQKFYIKRMVIPMNTKTVRIPQETAEIYIAALKERGNMVASITVDEANFMFLLVQYIPV